MISSVHSSNPISNDKASRNFDVNKVNSKLQELVSSRQSKISRRDIKELIFVDTEDVGSPINIGESKKRKRRRRNDGNAKSGQQSPVRS